MRVLYETPSIINRIQQSIDKWGSKPEHNVYYYMHNLAKNSKKVVFDFGADKLILASYDENLNIWSLFPSGILSPVEDSLDLLLQFSRYCLEERSGRKITMEIDDNLFHRFKDEIKNQALNFRVLKVNLVRYWPIINLKLWNYELKGKKWRKLRKMKNKFFKNNDVEIVRSVELPEDSVKNIVFDWKKIGKGGIELMISYI